MIAPTERSTPAVSSYEGHPNRDNTGRGCLRDDIHEIARAPEIFRIARRKLRTPRQKRMIGAKWSRHWEIRFKTFPLTFRGAARRMRSRLNSARGQIIHQRTAADDEDSIANAEQLLDFRGNDKNTRALVREIENQLIDLKFRADIDSARRFIKKQHFGFA